MDASEGSKGATAETPIRLMGRISQEDADEMVRIIIDDCCGRVPGDRPRKSEEEQG